MTSTQLNACKRRQSLFHGCNTKVKSPRILMLPPENDNNEELPNNTHTENLKLSIKKDEEKLIKVIRKNLAKLKATIATSKKPK